MHYCNKMSKWSSIKMTNFGTVKEWNLGIEIKKPSNTQTGNKENILDCLAPVYLEEHFWLAEIRISPIKPNEVTSFLYYGARTGI